MCCLFIRRIKDGAGRGVIEGMLEGKGGAGWRRKPCYTERMNGKRDAVLGGEAVSRLCGIPCDGNGGTTARGQWRGEMQDGRTASDSRL